MDFGALGVYAALFLALYFEVFLLISFFEKRPARKDAVLPKRYPTVTVLVPSYNEEETIEGTLDSLLALEYPKNKLQVLVIDDGSTDTTGPIAKRYAAVHPQVEYLYKKNGGKYTALNLGLEHCGSELVGCLDADSFVAQDALIEIVKRFEEDGVMAVVPAMKVNRPHTLLELMQAVEYTFGIFIKKMYDNISAISVLPGPFSFYRREMFGNIGLFRHAHNTEDMEIAFRMHQHGLKIVNAHTAHVYTTVPRTVRSLIRQRTRWSQGFLQNSKDYKHMYFNRRYGNFGLLVLPFGMGAFFAGIYAALYTVYQTLKFAVTKTTDTLATGVPLQLPTFETRFEWYYLDTNILMFLSAATILMTLLVVVLGQRISDTRLTLKSFVSYFLFFGLIAPLWLLKAAWGALLARESAWR